MIEINLKQKNKWIFVFVSILFVFTFSAVYADPEMTAKWYNTGSAIGTYTELTTAGATATDWDYNEPNRYLNISISGLDPTKIYEIKITIPTGLQFQTNGSWTSTTQTDAISSAEFIPLGNYNGYTNNLTGTLVITTSYGATDIDLYAVTTMDILVWNKLADAYLTAAGKNPVSVILIEKDNSSIISELKINSVKSKISFENDSYTSYSNNSSGKFYFYTDGNVYQNKQDYFYLQRTNWTSVNIAFKQITADVYAYRQSDGLSALYIDDSVTYPHSITNNKMSTTLNNVNTSTGSTASRFSYPVLVFLSTDGWNVGDKVNVHIKVTGTTYTGYTDALSEKNMVFTLSPYGYNFASDISIFSNTRINLSGTYYEGTDKIYAMSCMSISNTGAVNSNPIRIKLEYDIDNTGYEYPTYGRIPMPVGEYFSGGTVVLFNAEGRRETVSYTNTTKSTNDTNGVFINSNVIAEDAGLSGEWFFKSIEYTIGSVSAGVRLHNTSWGRPNLASSMYGRIYGTARNRITITDVNTGANKKATQTVSLTTEKTNNMIVSSISLPESVVAGNNAVITITLGTQGYSYQTTAWYNNPEIYIALPTGISIESAQSVGIGPATISTAKTITYNGESHTIYKISLGNNAAYGLFSKNSSQAKTRVDSTTDNTRKVEFILTTDESLGNYYLTLRPLLFVGDENSNFYFNTLSSLYAAADVFDLDNDGATSDYYGTLSATYTGNTTLRILDRGGSTVTTTHDVTLTWASDSGFTNFRGSSVRVALKANGIIIDYYDLTAAENWTHTFTYLPTYDSMGPITYTVEEVPMPYRYAASYDNSTPEITAVTNTLKFIDCTVTKIWDDDDNRDGFRPQSICIELKDDGKNTEYKYKLSGNSESWSHTFLDIPYSDNYELLETGTNCD